MRGENDDEVAAALAKLEHMLPQCASRAQATAATKRLLATAGDKRSRARMWKALAARIKGHAFPAAHAGAAARDHVDGEDESGFPPALLAAARDHLEHPPPPRAVWTSSPPTVIETMRSSMQPDERTRAGIRHSWQRSVCTHGLQSRVTWLGLRGHQSLEFRPGPDLRFMCITRHRRDGTVVAHPHMLYQLQFALEATDDAPVTDDEARSVQALMAEEIHGCGPDFWRALDGPGFALEASVTEILSRDLVVRLLGDTLSEPAREALRFPERPFWSWRDTLVPRGLTNANDIPLGRLLAVTRAHGIPVERVRRAAIALKASGADRAVTDGRAYLGMFTAALTGGEAKADAVATDLLPVLEHHTLPMDPGGARGVAATFGDVGLDAPVRAVAFFLATMATIKTGVELLEGDVLGFCYLARDLAYLQPDPDPLYELLLDLAAGGFGSPDFPRRVGH